MDEEVLSFERVALARERIGPFVRRTPVERSEEMGSRAGRDVYLKLENQQRPGAFKIRGALAKLLAMDPVERERGVLTASAGNHGQGVALAARLLNIPATVVLPVGGALTKLTAIQHEGAEVLLQGVAYDDAYAFALTLAAERGLAYVHAFDDPDVIA